MQKNLYYRTFFRRNNAIKQLFISLFFTLASWPRLLLEVFSRKNLGERYFSFSISIFLAILLAIAPYIRKSFGSYGEVRITELLMDNITWYLFIVAFLIFAYRRKQEIKRLPSVFDFARFSLSSGEINPLFKEIKIKGKAASIRLIETILEPACFLIIGIILILFKQPIGMLITFCSFLYSFSYFASYSVGDNFVMDMIDEDICSQSIINDFSDGFETNKSNGFRFRGNKPADPNNWRKVVDNIIVDEDFAAAS